MDLWFLIPTGIYHGCLDPDPRPARGKRMRLPRRAAPATAAGYADESSRTVRVLNGS